MYFMLDVMSEITWHKVHVKNTHLPVVQVEGCQLTDFGSLKRNCI